MLRLAVTTIRFRAAAFLAAFISMLLGAAIVMTFASLIDVSRGPAVSAQARENLITMAAVVGLSGLIIVLFSVATTMTLTVRQRQTEIAVLKSVGATPAQIRAMIAGEAAILAAIASVLAIPISILAGHALMRMLTSAGLVGVDTEYRFGLAAVGIGVAVTVVASIAAAWLTARRTAGMQIAESLLGASQERPHTGRIRAVVGWVFVAAGLSAAITSALVLDGADISILQIVAGEASLLSAIGLALLAPVMVLTCSTAISRALRPLLGVSGYLGALNIRRRPHQMSGSLIPIILLTAVTTGTLYTQRIDNAVTERGGPTSSDATGVQTLNYTVVAMLCVFAAIMLVNSLIAATTYRRGEFAQYRLLGFTPWQILRIVTAEEVAIVATGLIAGTLAGLLTIVPYSLARTDTAIPDVGPAIFLGTVLLVVVLAFAASLGAAHRAMRRAAIQQIPV